jgi:hypothetical protein
VRHVFYALLLLVVSACAPATSDQLRADPAGVHSFMADGDYQAVYQKVLSRAQKCFEQAAGGNMSVRGAVIPGSRSSTIIIENVRAVGAEMLFTIDISQSDADRTEVRVYYSSQRFRSAAATIEAWILKDSAECLRGRIFVECAC